MALWKFGHFKLVSKMSQKLLELGAWTRSADREWWVDYLIKFKKKIILFFRSYGPLKIWAFKLVSKISRKLFELGAWNLVIW